jgi:poly(3-hydroxybutyrate) depolymerase
MLYTAYQAQSDLTAPLRVMSGATARLLTDLSPGLTDRWMARSTLTTSEIVARWGLTHRRPAFGIDSVVVEGREVAVREEAVLRTPFGTLLRFAKDTDAVQPRVLLVAPLSGHFATLLRATVRTMLPDHDVFITDWHNARDIPARHGRFGLDEYIDHLVDFLRAMAPGAHVVAVCQPCVPALAAAALMAEDGDEAVPHSLTLMAGPIDARVSPTIVNDLAAGRSLEWFERNVIAIVPPRHMGAGRRVYPGFVQVAAFLRMNPERHRAALRRLYDDIVAGNAERAGATRAFYDEYFAVLDLTAEFYLETVAAIFQDHLLARGELTWRGRRVDPAAITRTALLTIEGERDDICGVGQTAAAHDLCTSLAPDRRRRHVQAGAGHFGVFSGARWEREVYPSIRSHILTAR